MQRLPSIHQPETKTHSLMGYQQIIRVIWIGTTVVMTGLLVLLVLSIVILHNDYVSGRVFIGVAILAYLSVAGVLLRHHHYQVAAWMLIALYTLLSTFILLIWGINAPVGILMLAFVIFLSGVMVGTKVLIPVSIGCVGLLFILYALDTLGITHPDRTSLTIEPSFGDVLTYATIFGIYALISRLSRRQIEGALTKAQRAEIALQKEKDLLKIRLEEQTRALREAQLDEIRQLYRFAEIGQLTTVMLHDLANSLSVLTLDVDDLHQQARSSSAAARVKESITYLDTVVSDLRKRLKESNHSRKFNAIRTLRDTVNGLMPKATQHKVAIELRGFSEHRSFALYGDPLRLSQCLTILINNAIDVCAESESAQSKPSIIIDVTVAGRLLAVSVIDFGGGIPEKIRGGIFTPLRSTKKTGMGIGLFITKQIIETHFKGTITLDPRHDRTEFIIKLPEYRK